MDEHIYTAMAALEERHWWFVARRKILSTLLSSLSLPADAQIFEAGCGTGGNLAMLASHGQVYGVEENTQAIKLASSKGAALIAPGRLPNAIPFAGKQFDLIALLDVLEHLDEDEASLRTLRTRLKPGGWLLITVPAYPFLWSRHDELHHHKRRYVATGLRTLITGAGYHIHYLSYFNTWLFPLIAAARLMQGSGGGHSGDLSMPNKIVNTLLKAIFSSERWLLGRIALPFGVSLVVLARNSD